MDNTYLKPTKAKIAERVAVSDTVDAMMKHYVKIGHPALKIGYVACKEEIRKRIIRLAKRADNKVLYDDTPKMTPTKEIKPRRVVMRQEVT